MCIYFDSYVILQSDIFMIYHLIMLSLFLSNPYASTAVPFFLCLVYRVLMFVLACVRPLLYSTGTM